MRAGSAPKTQPRASGKIHVALSRALQAHMAIGVGLSQMV
jgi:hypothetical protein